MIALLQTNIGTSLTRHYDLVTPLTSYDLVTSPICYCNILTFDSKFSDIDIEYPTPDPTPDRMLIRTEKGHHT